MSFWQLREPAGNADREGWKRGGGGICLSTRETFFFHAEVGSEVTIPRDEIHVTILPLGGELVDDLMIESVHQ